MMTIKHFLKAIKYWTLINIKNLIKHHLLFMQILECITEKIDGCEYNPEKLSTTKVSEHIQSGFSMPTISSFRSVENMHDVYKGKDCVKKLSEFLIQHAMKIIN